MKTQVWAKQRSRLMMKICLWSHSHQGVSWSLESKWNDPWRMLVRKTGQLQENGEYKHLREATEGSVKDSRKNGHRTTTRGWCHGDWRERGPGEGTSTVRSERRRWIRPLGDHQWALWEVFSQGKTETDYGDRSSSGLGVGERSPNSFLFHLQLFLPRLFRRLFSLLPQ